MKCLVMTRDVLEKVASFYKGNHFNDSEQVQKRAERLKQVNIIKARYPDLHRFLKRKKTNQILEIGCGVGWMTFSLNRHYGANTVSIDQSEYALKKTERLLSQANQRGTLLKTDLFKMNIVSKFDAVVSIGVLHHTHQLLKHQPLAKNIRRWDYVFRSYHKHARKEFLNTQE